MSTSISAIPFSSFVHLAIAPTADNGGRETHWRAEVLASGELIIRTWDGNPDSDSGGWQTCECLTSVFCANSNPVTEMRRRAAALVDNFPYHYVEAA